MNRTLPIRPQLLATGQAATLAFTVYDADGVTVLVARNFGNCTEVGNACYVGPSVVVDAAAAGSIRYDYGGTSGAVGTIAYEETFAPTAVGVGSYATGLSPAEQILAEPDFPLANNSVGGVALAGGVTVSGYAAGQDPFTLIGAGVLTFRDQTSVTAPTVMDAWGAAWVEASGEEAVVAGSPPTYVKKDAAGAAFRTFTLDSATSPTSRT